MNKKSEIIAAMKELNLALNKYHKNTQIAQYVQETINEFQASEAVDFIGDYTYFLTKASMLKRSEGIEFNEVEQELWRKVRSFKEVSYKLFPGIGF